jgi:signal peptidase II
LRNSREYGRRLALPVILILALLVIGLDRMTKFMAVDRLGDGSVYTVIPNILDFMLVYNMGAAWGILEGARFIFVIISVIATLALLAYAIWRKRHTLLSLLAIGLLIGGANGNAIDRALSGEVVDFIHLLFINFPLFNVADCAIACGVFLLFVLFFMESRADSRDRRLRALHSRQSDERELIEIKQPLDGSDTPGEST